MATYDEWNTGIIDYVLQGQPKGSYIFLSIDDSALDVIGKPFRNIIYDSSSDDFIHAVRENCLRNDKLYIKHLEEFKNEQPQGIAFLALMVLAAYRMGDDELTDTSTDPKAFFPHFNRLIGLDAEGRNFEGDEALWKQWNSWLNKHGFLPTAEPGRGSQKYINYAISQCLLRESDKKRLLRMFNGTGGGARWRKDLDERLLIAHLYRQKNSLTKHLQEILSPDKPFWQRSQEAIVQACFEIYEEWRESVARDTTRSTTSNRSFMRKTLDARVYREYDFMTDTTSYRLFAKYPRRLAESLFEDAHVEFNGERFKLIPENGWFRPFGEINALQLNQTTKLTVQNCPITTIYLPERKFWLLTLDPDFPETGIYATWGKGVELGNPFILLAHRDLEQEIENLRAEVLVKWETKVPIDDNHVWYEYRGMQVLAEARVWENLRQDVSELRLALKPTNTFSVLFVDGVRALERATWLVDYPPKIVVNAFEDDHIELQVFTDIDNKIFEGVIEPQQAIDIPWSGVGVYTIKLTQGSTTVERVVELVDLSSCQLAYVEASFPELHWSFFGAWHEG